MTCDTHRWEMKGVGHGGGGTQLYVGWQCMECGIAKVDQTSSPGNTGVHYEGWNTEKE